MKLDAMNGVFAMPNRHDQSLLIPGRDDQFIWQLLFVNRERMVPSHTQRLSTALKKKLAVVVDCGSDSMGRPTFIHRSTECDTDGLVPQADAKNWNPTGEVADHFDATTRIDGAFWAGGNDDRIRREVLAIRHVDLIAADNDGLLAKDAKVPRQVVYERVVIVQQ